MASHGEAEIDALADAVADELDAWAGGAAARAGDGVARSR
jgi:hypothetical protein